MRRTISIAIGILLMLSFFGLRAPLAETEVISVTDRAGLEAIRDNPGAAYRLDADIDLGGEAWVPIPLFTGVFDGNGHTLYNIRIESAGDIARSVYSSGHRHTEFPSYFSGFFALIEDAEIRDLTLLNVDSKVHIDDNCFAGGLAGYAWASTVTRCHMEGRVRLECSGKAMGAAGLIGCGFATVTDNTVYAEVTILDTAPGTHTGEHIGNLLGPTACEQFGGGLMSYGYGSIRGNRVDAQLWTAAKGFAHNGILMGIYFVFSFDKSITEIDVYDNFTSGDIYFYEKVPSRHEVHAYTSPFCGEPHPPISAKLKYSEGLRKINQDNRYENYQTHKLGGARTPFGAEKCASPDYSAELTAANCTEFGYTQYTCAKCKYSYRAEYVGRQHDLEENVVEPTYAEGGYIETVCTLCDFSAVVEELPPLPTPVPETAAPSPTPVEIPPEDTDDNGGDFNWLPILLPAALLLIAAALYVFGRLRRKARDKAQGIEAVNEAVGEAASEATNETANGEGK
ncbi:MAG: hypothetical protein FWF10_09685 [Clostridiales bacterium]|nr:hypothetical protein [Clostridiales bacterium]